MRYPASHKSKIQSELLDYASVALRLHGVNGVSITKLMRGLDRTHGGFYAYFESREKMVTAALGHALDRTTARWRKIIAAGASKEGFAGIVDSYLNRSHLNDPGSGCALPAVASDIGRAGMCSREAFSEKLDEMIDLISLQMPNVPAAHTQQRAIAAIATMMGTIILARASVSKERSDEILEAGRRSLLGWEI